MSFSSSVMSFTTSAGAGDCFRDACATVPIRWRAARLITLDESLLAANHLAVSGPPEHVVFSPRVDVEIVGLGPVDPSGSASRIDAGRSNLRRATLKQERLPGGWQRAGAPLIERISVVAGFAQTVDKTDRAMGAIDHARRDTFDRLE